MNAARILIAAIGLLLPFGVRLFGGVGWLKQYTSGGLGGVLFITATTAPIWLGLIGMTFLYRRPSSLLIPGVLTFGFLIWAHLAMDLAADAQAAIGLVLIPVAATPFLLAGGVAGFVVDRIQGRIPRD